MQNPLDCIYSQVRLLCTHYYCRSFSLGNSWGRPASAAASLSHDRPPYLSAPSETHWRCSSSLPQHGLALPRQSRYSRALYQVQLVWAPQSPGSGRPSASLIPTSLCAMQPAEASRHMTTLTDQSRCRVFTSLAPSPVAHASPSRRLSSLSGFGPQIPLDPALSSRFRDQAHRADSWLATGCMGRKYLTYYCKSTIWSLCVRPAARYPHVFRP